MNLREAKLTVSKTTVTLKHPVLCHTLLKEFSKWVLWYWSSKFCNFGFWMASINDSSNQYDFFFLEFECIIWESDLTTFFGNKNFSWLFYSIKFIPPFTFQTTFTPYQCTPSQVLNTIWKQNFYLFEMSGTWIFKMNRIKKLFEIDSMNR